ncbi:MAG: DUF817 domain-containing protein [Bacteroidetes bacterium]|nr:DUF817 domain-containing protein [Bacteroidota bacterium]
MIERYWRSLFYFGIKNAVSCSFAIFIFVMLALSKKLEYHWIYRYDFLLILCIMHQVCMVLWKIESKDELLVICMFHVLGLLLELYKVHKGSWSYPEPGLTKIFGVPLYSGFMYASVASYMCQAWRWFDLKLIKPPHQIVSVLLAMAIYLNFFTHHYIYDFRWALLASVFVIYFPSKIYFTPNKTVFSMHVVVSMTLIGVFIWIAENIATFLGAWKYTYQHHNWTIVDAGKLSSWILMAIVSYIIIFELKRVKGELE